MRLVSRGLLTTALVLAGAAFGQPRTIAGFDSEQLTLNPAGRDGLLIGTSDLLAERTFRGSVVLHYEHNPLLYVENGAVVGAVIRSRLSAHFIAAYGIKRWLEVGLQLPVVLFQKGDALDQVEAPASGGVGTAWLQGRVGFLTQSVGQPLDLGLQLALGVPLGSASALTSDGQIGFSAMVQGGRAFGVIRIGAEVGALVRAAKTLSPDSPTISDQVGSALLFGAQLNTINQGLRGELSVLTRVPFTKTPAAVEVLLGGRYPVGPIEIFALIGPGFGREPGTPAFRAMLGVSVQFPSPAAAASAAPEAAAPAPASASEVKP